MSPSFFTTKKVYQNFTLFINKHQIQFDLNDCPAQDIERLSRDIERQEEKLSRTVAELNSDIQRLQRELAEQRDELESTVIKRDAVKRDMER